MIGAWRVARNAAPPTVEQLRETAGFAEREVAALEAEGAEIVEALPELIAGAGSASAETRLAEIEALLPIKRRKLEMIRKAIPAAENRDIVDRIRADRRALETRTAKLKRGLPERYNRAAESFAQVLREIAENSDEWRRSNLAGRPFGERDGDSAEMALRREIGVRPSAGGMPGGWASLCDDIEVRDWNGRLIFGGPAGSY